MPHPTPAGRISTPGARRRATRSALRLAPAVAGATLLWRSRAATRTRRELEAADRRRTILQEVASAANAYDDLREAAEHVFGVLAGTRWPVGHLYLANAEGTALVDTGLWSPATLPRHRPLVTQTADWDRHRPWTMPVEEQYPLLHAWEMSEVTSPRAEAALRTGLTWALSAPLLSGTTVVGILEVMTSETSLGGADLAADLATFEAIATVLSRVHDRAEARRLAAERATLADRQRYALELNDTIVQGLTTALYALELEDDALAAETLRGTLSGARSLITELLRGSDSTLSLDLLQRTSSAQVAPPPAAPSATTGPPRP